MSADMRTIKASTLGDSFLGEYERIADVECAHIPAHGSWLVLDCDWDAIHIVPVLDALIHHVDASDECLCGPSAVLADNGHHWVVSHASLDGRELREAAPD